MKTVEVNSMPFPDRFPQLGSVSDFLDNQQIRHSIDVVNWVEFAYKPLAGFTMGYTRDEIMLKFYVTEKWFRAEKRVSNEAVYEDSCVEFFVSPGNDGIYYNFEFNGIGTCLAGVGKGRHDRERIAPEAIDLIRRHSSAGNEPVREKRGKFSWDITIAIPYDVFVRHKISYPAGQTFSANFYKCGDTLRIPHYLSWSPVGTLKPDYHKPEYFGLLKFI